MKEDTPESDALKRQQCWSSRRRRDRQGTVSSQSSIRWVGRRGCGSNLSDILVPDTASLLDVCGALGDLLNVVTGKDELILLGLGGLNVDTVLHDDLAHNLLAQEVSVPRVSAFVRLFRVLSFRAIPDLDLPKIGLLVLLKADVDGEMGVYVAHLVLEALDPGRE